MTEDLEQYFAKGELIPAVVQEASTGQVLMLAYMNQESLKRTLESGYTWFWSRSRQELWNKGATSGHLQKVVAMYSDCDNDTLLVQVEQTGAACHTGHHSCFIPRWRAISMTAIEREYQVILDRRADRQEGSYTCYLFDQGIDKILKKVGEECTEMVIAAKNNDKDETVYEITDLIYHTLVMMANQGITPADIQAELDKRAEKAGNLKNSTRWIRIHNAA